jgi:hypothetical protein
MTTTTPTTGNTPTSPKPGTSSYIFIACLLEASQHGATLDRLINQPEHTTEVFHALWAGRRALRHEELDFACRARKAGQLLFAFKGTTVLEGGAA